MKNTSTPSIRFHAMVLGLLLLGALPGSAYAQSDSTFQNSDWNCVVLIPPSNSSSTASCTQDMANGNNAPSRRTIHSYAGLIQVAHLFQPASALYNPSTQGALTGLSFSYDLIQYTQNNTPPKQKVAYHLLIFQNNTYYRSGANDGIGNITWTSFSHPNLTAANFVWIAGPGKKTPDFSCTGSVIQFGYITGNSNTQKTESGIDNWKVTFDPPSRCCFSRTTEKIVCSSGGGYSYTVTLQNQTGASIQQVVVAAALPAIVTPQIHSLTAVALGATTTLQVKISGAPAGSNVCLLFVGFSGSAPICSTNICFTLPACPP